MTFKTQLTTDLGTVFFNTDHFAETVTYNGNPIQAIFVDSQESLQSPRPPGDELIILVQESDVASPDLKSDTVTIDSETWYVTGDLTGAKSGGVWKLRLSRSERRVL